MTSKLLTAGVMVKLSSGLLLMNQFTLIPMARDVIMTTIVAESC